MVILKGFGDLGSTFNYKFQNLGSASGVDGRFQKICGALMKVLLRQSLCRFGAAHPVGMEDFRNY